MRLVVHVALAGEGECGTRDLLLLEGGTNDSRTGCCCFPCCYGDLVVSEVILLVLLTYWLADHLTVSVLRGGLTRGMGEYLLL